MEWLEPWWGVDPNDRDFCDAFEKQFVLEVRHGHPMYGFPVRLIARGNGDDCLFSIEDGSNRVAVVHLVWQGPQQPPWPACAIFPSLGTWVQNCMIPQHREWVDD